MRGKRHYEAGSKPMLKNPTAGRGVQTAARGKPQTMVVHMRWSVVYERMCVVRVSAGEESGREVCTKQNPEGVVARKRCSVRCYVVYCHRLQSRKI